MSDVADYLFDHHTRQTLVSDRCRKCGEFWVEIDGEMKRDDAKGIEKRFAGSETANARRSAKVD